MATKGGNKEQIDVARFGATGRENTDELKSVLRKPIGASASPQARLNARRKLSKRYNKNIDDLKKKIPCIK